MKMKSFALLAMPALLAVSFAYISPVFADDSVDEMNNNSSFQTLADNTSTQNQDNNSTDTNSNNGADTNNNSVNNNNTNNSNNDEGSPDAASSTGDDDY